MTRKTLCSSLIILLLPTLVGAGDFRLADALMKSCLQTFSSTLHEALEDGPSDSRLMEVRGAASRDVELCAVLAIEVCSIGVLESQNKCFAKIETSFNQLRLETLAGLPENVPGRVRSRIYQSALARARSAPHRLEPSPAVPPQLVGVLSEAFRLADARMAQRYQLYAQQEVQK